MKKFKSLVEAASTDYNKVVDDEKGKGKKRASKGEENFEKSHTVAKKDYPVPGNDKVFTGATKPGSEHKGFEHPGEPVLKTYSQFAKMGGLGKSSYRSADRTAGDKAAVMQGSSKVKEEVEHIDEAFKAGDLKLKSGETVKVNEDAAKALNSAIGQLSGTNKKRMEEEALKNKKSFESMLKFAKSVR